MITTLSQLTAIVESNEINCAVRIEPAYRPDLTVALPLIRKHHPGRLSHATYEMILRCSWGRFQIMGDNLYKLGLKVSVIEYCNDADMQEIFYYRYCESRKIAYTLEEVLSDRKKLENYAWRYNGSRAYANRLQSVYDANNQIKIG